ncbi:MAPEG family protein [Coralliovum pocilloporae]|uniref:MAPEG family protein n=1 Tax=Coralliovum pocilloporae TaxID=3066369 RepID=UPI0033075594
MQFEISGLYVGLLGLFMVVIAFRVPLRRRSEKIGLGTGGDSELTTRIRVFGNFIEYVPMALLMLVLLENRSTPEWALHALGLTLLGARILHAVGLSATDYGKWRLRARFYGALLTFIILLIEALWLISGALAGV